MIGALLMGPDLNEITVTRVAVICAFEEPYGGARSIGECLVAAHFML